MEARRILAIGACLALQLTLAPVTLAASSPSGSAVTSLSTAAVANLERSLTTAYASSTGGHESHHARELHHEVAQAKQKLSKLQTELVTAKARAAALLSGPGRTSERVRGDRHRVHQDQAKILSWQDRLAAALAQVSSGTSAPTGQSESSRGHVRSLLHKMGDARAKLATWQARLTNDQARAAADAANPKYLSESARSAIHRVSDLRRQVAHETRRLALWEQQVGTSASSGSSATSGVSAALHTAVLQQDLAIEQQLIRQTQLQLATLETGSVTSSTYATVTGTTYGSSFLGNSASLLSQGHINRALAALAAVLAGGDRPGLGRAFLRLRDAARFTGGAPGGIPVVVNGRVMVPLSGQTPTIAHNRLLVPLRAISQLLNAKVAWNGATQTITVQSGSTTVQMQVGSTTYTINGKASTMPVAPIISRGRTLVPVRFLAQALGERVTWIGHDGGLVVLSPGVGG